MYLWNNIALIEDDSHFTPWVKKAGRLDHHQGFLKTLEPFLKGTVVDIGANIGTHSIFYSRFASQLFCFEPNPLAFQCLKHNLRNTNANLFQVALSDHHHRIDLISQEQNYGANYTVEGSTINAIPLDSLIDLFSSCDFIKIDAEGDELVILQGATELIQKFKPVICIEINEHTLIRKGISGNDVLLYIQSLGYELPKTRHAGTVCEDFILKPIS
jgi:FkbM family methyltransferase